MDGRALALGGIAALAAAGAVRAGSRQFVLLHALPASVATRVEAVARAADATVKVEAQPENLRIELWRGPAPIGWFRASTMGTADWQIDQMPEDCRAAWESLGRPPLWIVRATVWHDETLKGRGLGRQLYEALIGYAHARGGIVAPDRCAGGVTSPAAERVWTSLRRSYRSAGPLLFGSLNRRGSRTSAPLVLWHGSQRWEGPPEIREARTGNVEHGPGIYLTTSASRARLYAMGGGSVVRMEIDPELGWLEDARLPVAEMLEFVQSRPRLRKRAQIEADLRRAQKRMGRDDIPAATLLNLMVNHEMLTGSHGPALAAFYVARGIDASHVTRFDEDWVVLFNPAKVRSWRKVPGGSGEDAPRITRPRRL